MTGISYIDLNMKEAAKTVTDDPCLDLQQSYQKLDHIPNKHHKTVIQEVHTMTNRRYRTLAIMAGVCFSIAVIAGITLGAVFLGVHLTRMSIKAGQVTVHTAEGVSYNEIIIVKELEVEVKVPRKFTVLSDYRKLLSVYRVEHQNGPRCYVSNLNSSVVGTLEEMENRINAKDVFISPDAAPVKYVSSGKEVSITTLSEHAQNMCSGVPIEWISEVGDRAVLRHKRCSGKDEDEIVVVIDIITIIKEECIA